MPMIHPEEGSAARLVLIHRAVDYNQQGRLHILFTGFPAVITINNTNNKSIKQYRHNGDVYIVMDNCKDGVGSSVICSSAPNSYSSLLAVPVKSDNGNQSLYNHRNPPIIRCIEEWFERIGQYFRNFLQRRKKLRNLPLPDSRKSDERISRSDNDDDKSSVGRKLYDFQKSSSCDLRMDNLPFNVETYTLGQTPHSFAVDPQGHWYIIWLTIVTFAYLYNCLVIPLRNAFPYQTPDNIGKWMFWDYFMDLVYLLDVLLIKPRIKYLDDGFWIQDPELTKQHYVQKFQYKMDLLALLPLDLLYIKFGTEHSYLRLPRLLKIQTFWEFFEVLDNYTSSSYVIRVVRTLTYMLYLVHLNTCAYYAVSVYEGIGSNKWVYNGEGNAYIRCFYRATKTAACIGKNPKPSNEIEYLFMTASWLMGVFVFAILIGQIALGTDHNEGF